MLHIYNTYKTSIKCILSAATCTYRGSYWGWHSTWIMLTRPQATPMFFLKTCTYIVEVDHAQWQQHVVFVESCFLLWWLIGVAYQTIAFMGLNRVLKWRIVTFLPSSTSWQYWLRSWDLAIFVLTTTQLHVHVHINYFTPCACVQGSHQQSTPTQLLQGTIATFVT